MPVSVTTLFEFVNAAQGWDAGEWNPPLRIHSRESTTVVFVNGVGTQTGIKESGLPPLRSLAAALAARPAHSAWEFTYAADDLSGYGPSDTVRSYSLAGLAQKLERQLRASDLLDGRRIVLVGHSQGGLIVAAFLRRYHQRNSSLPGLSGAAFVAAPWSLGRDELTWPTPATYTNDQYKRAKQHIEGLIRSVKRLGTPIGWAHPPTFVSLCNDESDGVLDSPAYAGRWTANNVTMRIWPSTPKTLLPHTRIAWEDQAALLDWLNAL